MATEGFQFKQFSVSQDRCAMKVGTDGVLLGAWCRLDGCRTVLDIGTGTGLLALMAAQRSDARITAIEIDSQAASQARENVMASVFKDRIEVIEADARTFRPADYKFDAIISNPPFFKSSLHSPDALRTAARHDDSLSHEDLVATVAALLSDSGKFSVVLPADCASAFMGICARSGLMLTARTQVVTREGQQPRRELMEFRKSYEPCRTSVLTIADAQGSKTQEYIELVKDFYIRIS